MPALRKAKRGLMQLQMALSIGITLFIMAGLIIGLAAFNASTADANATAFLDNGLDMFTKLSGQFATIGTLLGVGILIAVIGGAFIYLGSRRGGGGF